MKKVAVIILTWNSHPYLPALFDSVFKQSYSSDLYDVIVVDNASSDDTISWIKEHYPQTIILANQDNLGYAAGNNIGLKYALEKGYEYLVLLNHDMKVASDWLSELVRVADGNLFAGIIQSKILFMQEEYRVNSVGNPLHPLGFSWSGGYKKLSSDFRLNKPITLASGACLLIKRLVLETIGYFDEVMYLYSEDVDFSWRARLAGFDIWLAAESKVFHDHKFSLGGKKFFWSERNRLLNYFSHYRLWTLLVFLPAFIFTEILIFFYAFSTGWGVWKLKSYFSLIGKIPYIFKKRRRTKAIRQVSDREMLKLMIFRLDFEDVNNFLLKYFYNTFSVIYFKIARFFVF